MSQPDCRNYYVLGKLCNKLINHQMHKNIIQIVLFQSSQLINFFYPLIK